MADISDEFKIVLVDAIRSLCLKFSHKFPVAAQLPRQQSLREEGGYRYKKAIVDAMLARAYNDVKEAQELGLECFCEFIEDCVDGDALVSMADGTARPLREVRAGDRVLAWRQGEGLVASEVTRAVAKGVQPCVELLFADGRTLVCTADHRVLTADGRWVAAGELRVGEDAVMAGVEYPVVSMEEAADSAWKLDCTASLGVVLDMQAARSRSLAFARLLGNYQLACKGDNTEQQAIDVEHRLDAQDVLADVELVTAGVSKPSVDDATPTQVVLPSELTSAMSAVCASDAGVAASIPAFLLDPACPLPVVREFLGGLFGSTAIALVLQGKQDAVESGNVNKHNALFSAVSPLLERCGVAASEAVIAARSQKELDGNSEFTLQLNSSAMVPFAQSVGFRYSCQKSQRLTAAVSLHRTAPDAFDITVNRFQTLNATTAPPPRLHSPTRPTTTSNYRP